MSPRFFALLVGAGVLVFACGPRTGQSNVSTHTSVRKAPASRVNDTAPSLDASLAVAAKNGVALSLRVVNTGARRVEFKFPNARRYDFAVLDSLGREVWRWSAGRMFTQTMQLRSLASNDTLSYSERWTPPASGGTFTAVAQLKSSNHPVEQRTQFTVAPAAQSTAAR